MTTGSWDVLEPADTTRDFHVVPVGDAIEHLPDGCACGPRVEPVESEDGGIAWLAVHHSLDGREQHE